MTLEDFEIVIIKDVDSNTFTAYPKNLTGLIVQCDNFEDIPKEISKSYLAMINYSFEQKNYTLNELNNQH